MLPSRCSNHGAASSAVTAVLHSCAASLSTIRNDCLSDSNGGVDSPPGGLSNLRVCLKHFNETKQMAKTRIKTTPTRMQKNALAAAAATTFSNSPVPDDIKKRLRPKQLPHNGIIAGTLDVGEPAPAKRTNSISSAASSISGTDSPCSVHSPANIKISCAASCVGQNEQSTITATSTMATLKNRRVYMITEKCDDGRSATATRPIGGQKRKMYLIMEENGQEDQISKDVAGGKILRLDQSQSALPLASRKLTLFADKCDGQQLPQRFEKILPEILNRIQIAKNGGRGNGDQHHVEMCDENRNGTPASSQPTEGEYASMERMPITLPPKKNRTKICVSPGNIDDTQSPSICNSNEQIAAAIPVIVAGPSLNSNHNQSMNSRRVVLRHSQSTMSNSGATQQRNINLSPDFLFLMKMLPKLENIPEPHKNHVKNCIENIITQSSSTLGEH